MPKTVREMLIVVMSTLLVGLAGLSIQSSQPPQPRFIDPWARTYGGPGIERANAIQQTPDGGFIVVGRTTSFGADEVCFDRPCFNVWVLKLDANGAIQWQMTYDGPAPDDDDVGLAIQQFPDGDGDGLPDGYLVAATTMTPANQGDAWLFQLDEDGDVIWALTLGTPGGFDELISLQLLPDGPDPDLLPDGAIAAGFLDTDPEETVNWDVWVVLVALAPAPPGPPPAPVLWQISLPDPPLTPTNDIALSIQQIAPGEYILAGQTALEDGDADALVVRFEPNPDPLEFPLDADWEGTYGGPAEDEALAILPAATPPGGFVVTARTQSFGQGEWDIWNLWVEADGEPVQSITYGGPLTDEVTSPTSIQPTADGGFIMVGRTASFGAGGFPGLIPFDAWVLQLDLEGDVIGGMTYGGFGANDEALSVQPTADGDFIVAGSTASFGAGNGDIWVLRLGADGDIGGCIPEGAFMGAFAPGIMEAQDIALIEVTISEVVPVLPAPAEILEALPNVIASSATVTIQCAGDP